MPDSNGCCTAPVMTQHIGRKTCNIKHACFFQNRLCTGADKPNANPAQVHLPDLPGALFCHSDAAHPLHSISAHCGLANLHRQTWLHTVTKRIRHPTLRLRVPAETHTHTIFVAVIVSQPLACTTMSVSSLCISRYCRKAGERHSPAARISQSGAPQQHNSCTRELQAQARSRTGQLQILSMASAEVMQSILLRLWQSYVAQHFSQRSQGLPSRNSRE